MQEKGVTKGSLATTLNQRRISEELVVYSYARRDVLEGPSARSPHPVMVTEAGGKSS